MWAAALPQPLPRLGSTISQLVELAAQSHVLYLPIRRSPQTQMAVVPTGVTLVTPAALKAEERALLPPPGK